MALNADEESDVVRKFGERLDAEKHARQEAGTVEAIAAKLGVPTWHVYNVVLTAASSEVATSHIGPPGREKLGILVSNCVDYAKAGLGGGEFGSVWKSRRREYIKEAAKDFVDPPAER